MCGGIEVREQEKLRKLYFVGENAALPVMLENTDVIEWIRWGRRKTEKVTFPAGGWARLTTVQAGDWNVLQPKRGVAVVERFSQGEGSPGLRGRRLSKWVFVPKGQGLECLVIGQGEDRRAYIVTTTAPPTFKPLQDRWPLLTDLLPADAASESDSPARQILRAAQST